MNSTSEADKREINGKDKIIDSLRKKLENITDDLKQRKLEVSKIRDDKESLKIENQSIQKNLEEANKKLQNSNKEKQDLKDDLTTKLTEIEGLEEECRVLEDNIKDLEEKLHDSEQQLVELEDIKYNATSEMLQKNYNSGCSGNELEEEFSPDMLITQQFREKIIEQVEWQLEKKEGRKLGQILQTLTKKMSESVRASKEPLTKVEDLSRIAFEINSGEKFFDVLFDSVQSNFFGDLGLKLQNVENAKELSHMLADEIERGRRCMEELVLGLDGLLKNLLEKEIWCRYQEEGVQEYKTHFMRLKSVLKDPEFKKGKELYYEVAVRQIREERAKKSIAKWMRLRKQGQKLKKLENRHRSQYELFQAGSGKYLLQLLMQKIEDNAYEIFEHVRPEIDVEFERRRKTAFSKLK